MGLRVTFIDFARLHDSGGLRMLLHVAPISRCRNRRRMEREEAKTRGRRGSRRWQYLRSGEIFLTLHAIPPAAVATTGSVARQPMPLISALRTSAFEIKGRPASAQYTVAAFTGSPTQRYTRRGGEANGGICRLDMVGPLVGGFAGSEPSGC